MDDNRQEIFLMQRNENSYYWRACMTWVENGFAHAQKIVYIRYQSVLSSKVDVFTDHMSGLSFLQASIQNRQAYIQMQNLLWNLVLSETKATLAIASFLKRISKNCLQS